MSTIWVIMAVALGLAKVCMLVGFAFAFAALAPRDTQSRDVPADRNEQREG